MECFEEGLLITKDTNGTDLRFGNHEAMMKVVDLIANREGIGDLLAEGVARGQEDWRPGRRVCLFQMKMVFSRKPVKLGFTSS